MTCPLRGTTRHVWAGYWLPDVGAPDFCEPTYMVFTLPVSADPYPPTRASSGSGAALSDSTPPSGPRALPVGPGHWLSRRAVLAGLGAAATGAALAAAGCTSKPSPPAADLLATDSLGPLYRETEELIRQYDAALTGMPSLAAVLGPLREEHRQHLTALASLIGLPTPTISAGPNQSGIPFSPPSGANGSSPESPSPAQTGSLPAEGDDDSSAPASTPATNPPAAAATVRAALSEAEKTAQANAVTACVAARPNRVAVLASIAACRATHVAALR